MIPSRRPGTMLVTGGARGIGRATADLFLARGWRVGISDVDGAAAADAAAGHRRAVHGALDVRDAEQWRAVLAELCGDGPLDVLVNNAGVLASGPFAGMALATHQRMVDINLTGVCLGAATGHGYLRRSRHGVLLNLCSASALYGQPALATYGATKTAVKSPLRGPHRPVGRQARRWPPRPPSHPTGPTASPSAASPADGGSRQADGVRHPAVPTRACRSAHTDRPP